MTALNIQFNHDAFERIPKEQSTPFCQRGWKTTYVIIQVVKDFFISLANYIASSACYLFSKKWTHYFAQKADYHAHLSASKFFSYLSFGKEIIDFSINMSPQTVDPLLPGQTHKDAFIKKFGQKATDLFNSPQKEVSFNESALNLKTKGNCRGMSLYFIFLYLSLIREGKSPIDAVHTVAQQFERGTPDEAWFIQILSRAVRTPSQQSKDEWIAKIANLQMIGNRKKLLTDNPSELSTFLSDLPEGAHEIGLFPAVKKGSYIVLGHAVMIIKAASNTFFFFDANQGTIPFDHAKMTKALWDCSEDYRKETKCEFSSIKHELLSSS